MQESEFEDYVRAHARRLRSAAFALCGDWHHAEDLVQTALVRAHPALLAGRARDPDSYVARTMINVHRSWRRRLWHGEHPWSRPPDGAAAVDADLDLALAVRAALRELPRLHREVLALRYLLDLSERQTADVLGISPGTVKSRTSRALDQLRQLEAVNDLTEVGRDA